MPTDDPRRPVVFAIGAAIATIALKAGAYWLTNSVGLFSDALESGVNLLAAVAAFLSLRYADRPADSSHTYGHEKIEFFSSGLEGGLVGLAGIGTILYASRQLIDPQPLAELGIGSAIAVLAAGINAAAARSLLRAGNRHKSPLLRAAGHHLLTDVWTSLGVISGLGLVAVTGLIELDALLAFGIGAYILTTGFRLMRTAFHGLMDHALPAAEQTEIRNAIQAALPAGTTFHLLRTRQAGRRRLADFHLLVPGTSSVRDAHALAHGVEARVNAVLPGVSVTIHVEPIEEAASWEATELKQLGESVRQPPAGDRPS